jgi:hypothetical protein
MSPRQRDRERIRELNDQVRTAGPHSSEAVRWLLTPGVRGFGVCGTADAIRLVQAFAAFDTDNDPHGEHDFGSFDLLGERLFWKIDYYNRSLTGGSSDPGDENVTCRVLTIMLALEY